MSIFRSLGARLARRLGRAAPIDALHLEALESYGAHARRAGIERLHLFLSFDCDTDLDALAAQETHRFLTSRGVKATYAVPGAQLEKGAATYRKLAELGAEFMNHGGRPHAEWREDRWVGLPGYEEIDDAAAVADIRRGHEIVSSVIGVVPLGFRAPHFGSYQQPAQLALIHSAAAALGYRYCSTTTPAVALARGPAYLTHGLVELPCFGSARNPTTLLDSWTYLIDRKKYKLADEYYELFAETVAVMVKRRIPGLLTWYADPSHVVNQRPFIRAIEAVAEHGIPSFGGIECEALVRRHLGPARAT